VVLLAPTLTPVAFNFNPTMAAGSRRKYALDLNDPLAFPDGDNIPSRPPNTEEGESWVVLLEVGLLCLQFQTLFFVVTWIFIRRKDKGFSFFQADIWDGRHHR
jgi:hypothetical protein